jgi:hypothetical protein
MTTTDPAYEKARQEKERHREELMSLNNVVGVGVGRKPAGGHGLDHWAIAVYVHKKVPPSELEPKDIIPAEINGIPTDVIEIGTPVNYDANNR